MASESGAKAILDSLEEKVAGLKQAVDKLDAAVEQLAADAAQDQKKAPAVPKPATPTAGQ